MTHVRAGVIRRHPKRKSGSAIPVERNFTRGAPGRSNAVTDGDSVLICLGSQQSLNSIMGLRAVNVPDLTLEIYLYFSIGTATEERLALRVPTAQPD
jgi:hypothetical protein